MQREYPGLRDTFAKTIESLVLAGEFPPLSGEDVTPINVLFRHLLFGLRYAVAGQYVLKELAESAEKQLEETFPVGAV
jgi:hypothetical protein